MLTPVWVKAGGGTLRDPAHAVGGLFCGEVPAGGDCQGIRRVRRGVNPDYCSQFQGSQLALSGSFGGCTRRTSAGGLSYCSGRAPMISGPGSFSG
jgi:hypothetical protein